MRPASAPRLRRRGFVETLEPRIVLSAAGTAVGDAHFALYDGAVISTLPTGFSRDVPTINGQGEAVGVDVRRFGEALNYTPVTQWTEVPVTLTPSTLRYAIGSGWDHDGETPLLVNYDQTFHRLTFFRGEDFEVVHVLQFNSNDMMRGTIAGERFTPRAAIVHHGLIVIATARSVLVDDVYKTVGVDFFATQDYGVTMERIAVAGGGYGLPVIEESIGRDRLQTWSFLNPFPVEGIDDTNAAWFPWADYIYRTGAPKGGQVGLFRADRPEGADHWVISPNRVVFSQWIEEDDGGFHSHTAAITTGGLISHWGDVGYRNVTMFHKFDLANYETASVESQVVYGGYSPTATNYVLAPQPVAAAPSPVPGEHFAGGDETPDHVLSFGALTDFNDRLDVEALIYQPEILTPGGVHGGAAVLHLQWVQGVGYVAAAAADNNYYYSPDGEQWIEFYRPPTKQNAVTWLYGNRLLTQSDGKFWTAALPKAEVVHPLQIAPGGTNELAAVPEWRREPPASNSIRPVVYSDNAWRYQDTLQPLSTQPPASPFGLSTPVYEVNVNGTVQDLGSLWLQPLGETSDGSEQHVVEMWIANLAEQGVSFGANQGFVNAEAGVSKFGHTLHYEVNDNVGWIPVGVSAEVTSTSSGRFASDWRTYYRTPGARFLVAMPYFGAGLSPTYPLAPQASGADELESLSLPDLGDFWSVGIVTHWPQNAAIDHHQEMPIASLTGHDGDSVEFTLRYSNRWTDLYTDVYSQGVRQSRTTVRTPSPENIQRGDWLEIVVSYGQELTIDFVTSGDRVTSSRSVGQGTLQLDDFQWADRTGDVTTSIDPMLVVFDDQAWSEAERKAWLGAGLYEKAIFNSYADPGDFNRDGAVDAADYSVWRDTLADATPGRPGDLNVDGSINEADRLIWAAQYGLTGVGLAGDLNADGVVDAGDYTVWRDLAALQVIPGTGADADRNGFVELADLQYWIEDYGAAYPTFATLRDSFFAEATAGFDGVANEDDLPREVAETLTPSPVAAEFAFFTMRVSAESPTTPPVRASSSAASIASAKDLSLLLLESTRSSLSSEEIVVALGVDGSPSTAAERLTLDEALACRVADGVVDPIAADYL